MAVTAMHRISAWRERLTFAPAIRRVARHLPVHNIRRDRQHALGMSRTAIGGMFTDFLHEPRNEVRRNAVHAIVIVTELWDHTRAFVEIIDDETAFVPYDVNPSIFDCCETVGGDRQAGDAERHGAQHI